MLILLPPSEAKQSWWHYRGQSLHYPYIKPLDIAIHASAKDLKCKGDRYQQWIHLNHNIEQWPRLPAMDRYNGVMYKAIWYNNMSDITRVWFDNHVNICCGMHGLVHPQDQIADYKLPIDICWLAAYWRPHMTQILNQIESNLIIDLLPLSYRKMIDRSKIDARIVKIDFYNTQGDKYTHGVKWVRGRRLKDICKLWELQIPDDIDTVWNITI
jgi:hypothetical protein